ncbi:MAG: cell division protein CrgA [Actinomycetota bacterium]|nr:cell division protein CrgA [Actinomycetota bacterium]
MPKSKSKRRRYQPPPKPKPKPSPKWYGPVILFLMGAGVLVIVLNYMDLMPGPTSNTWLWTGLGAIAVGFVGATQLR